MAGRGIFTFACFQLVLNAQIGLTLVIDPEGNLLPGRTPLRIYRVVVSGNVSAPGQV